MSYALSLEKLEKFLNQLKVEEILQSLENYQDILKYIELNQKWFNLDKWAYIYFKLINSKYEYTYGPPVYTFINILIKEFHDHFLHKRKLLLKLKKDSKLSRFHFTSILPEKLRLSYLIKSKKRCYAVETHEGLYYVNSTSYPWKNSELIKIAKNKSFINNPTNLKVLIELGIPLESWLVIETLHCPEPYSFLSLPKETISFLNSNVIKSIKVSSNLRKWKVCFNVNLLKQILDHECLICYQELTLLHRSCPYQHYTCATCVEKVNNCCPYCGFIFS